MRFLHTALAAAVAWAALSLATPVLADVTITGGAVHRAKKKGPVTATLSGTFAAGDLAFEPGADVVIGFGRAAERIPVAKMRFAAKTQRWTYKARSKKAPVASALFDLRKGTFRVSLRSAEATDYRNPLHVGLDAPEAWSFAVPVNALRATTKIAAPVAGARRGEPVATGTFTGSGGTVTGGGVALTAPPGALRTDADVVISPTPLPAGLPFGAEPFGPAWDVSCGADGAPPCLEQPLAVTLTLPDFDPDDVVGVLHWDPNALRWDPVTVLAADPVGDTVTFETRAFSPFVPVVFTAAPGDAWSVPGFDPRHEGWSIENFGSYFSPGGNCLGMASWCTWFSGAHPSESLWTAWTGADARIVATRAHLAQSQFWAVRQSQWQDDLGPAATGRLMKAYMLALREPLVFVMFGPNAGHATVATGWDATGFCFYDVNVPGETQHVDWNGTAWGTYSVFDTFSFLAIPSLGRNQDFESIRTDALEGFHGASVHLTAPTEGSEVAARFVTVTGTVDDAAWDGVWVFANGEPFGGAITGGSFAVTVPVGWGENTVTVLAGTDILHQSSWSPGSGVQTVSFTCNVPVSELLVTLQWDQDSSDVDLYVHEPDGDVSWYSHKTTASGGWLDFDDTNGYGPEHYTSNTVLEGWYRVRVHNYSAHSSSGPSSGRVSVLVDEGTPQQRLVVVPFTIASWNSGNASPSGSGSDWADIAWIDAVNGIVTDGAPAKRAWAPGGPGAAVAPAAK